MHLLWMAIFLASFQYNYGQEETTVNIEDTDAIFDPLYDPIIIDPQQTNVNRTGVKADNKCGIRNKNDSIEVNQAENQSNFGEFHTETMMYVDISDSLFNSVIIVFCFLDSYNIS